MCGFFLCSIRRGLLFTGPSWIWRRKKETHIRRDTKMLWGEGDRINLFVYSLVGIFLSMTFGYNLKNKNKKVGKNRFPVLFSKMIFFFGWGRRFVKRRRRRNQKEKNREMWSSRVDWNKWSRHPVNNYAIRCYELFFFFSLSPPSLLHKI